MTRPMLHELLLLLAATVCAEVRALMCRVSPSTCRHQIGVGRS